MNIIHDKLMSRMENCKMIPITGCPTRIIKITFEGWKPKAFTVQDDELHNVFNMAISCLDNLLSLYDQTHAFSEPMLFYQPAMSCEDAKIGLKIGLMEIERYNEFYGENHQKESK